MIISVCFGFVVTSVNFFGLVVTMTFFVCFFCGGDTCFFLYFFVGRSSACFGVVVVRTYACFLFCGGDVWSFVFCCSDVLFLRVLVCCRALQKGCHGIQPLTLT